VPPAFPERLDRRRLAERARHAVYGSVIVLAVIIALDETSIRPREAIASVIGAAIATLLAELYADYLGETIREARSPTHAERVRALSDASAGMIAAALPVVFFVLAAADVMSMESAFDAAIWTGVGVVGFYAFVANRAAGFSVARSLLACVAFALLGTILVLIKAAVHH
jgi:hypothetical protein